METWVQFVLGTLATINLSIAGFLAYSLSSLRAELMTLRSNDLEHIYDLIKEVHRSVKVK